MRSSVLLPVLAFATAMATFASPLSAQQLRTDLRAAEMAALPEMAPAARERARTGPLLRSAATMAASAGGFAYALSREDGNTDELLVPVAAGVAASTLVGWMLSDAPRWRVLVGSVLGTLPASALAMYAAGVLEEEDVGNVPTIAFSVPHGLLTSAFAKRGP